MPDGGGLPEAIGPCGITFRRGDVSELASKLAYLLRHPEEWGCYRSAAPAHLELGILCASQRKYVEAIREYEQAVKLDPKLPDAHYRLAQACVRTKQNERAQREFALYDRMHKEQVAETERRRSEIKQFIYTMKGGG